MNLINKIKHVFRNKTIDFYENGSIIKPIKILYKNLYRDLCIKVCIYLIIKFPYIKNMCEKIIFSIKKFA